MNGEPKTDWEALLLAFLHDPVDKALGIRGHESRAARYATAALDRTVTQAEIKDKARIADPRAAAAERLPMGSDGERAVGPEDGALLVLHPVSGESGEVRCQPLDEERVIEVITGVVRGLSTPRERFLALWRLLPERLEAEFGSWITRLPADSRTPDHSLFAHADITAGLAASLRGDSGRALVSLSFGPVQSFIEASRSVRDLWTGSAILSWLAFEAMRPVLESLGPTAFVYPALRRNPLMDRWLRRQAGLGEFIPQPDQHALRSPSLPNRFVALAPAKRAHVLAGQCEASVRDGWKRLADAVHSRCDERLSSCSPGWDRLWNDQVAGFLEVQATVVSEKDLDDGDMARLVGGSSSAFSDVWPAAEKVRQLEQAIPLGHRYGFPQDSTGRWQAQLEVSARVMEANRQIRHVPAAPLDRDALSPAKCSLFGSWEQMGPAEISEANAFWKRVAEKPVVDGVRIRENERLCAVALVKRFAGPAFFAEELGLSTDRLRFPDTATVAGVSWLREAGIHPDRVRSEHGEWSGRWLHDGTSDEERAPGEVAASIRTAKKEQGAPPAYYAILKMDGDDLGLWLRGDKSPKVREVLHRKLRDYYEGLNDARVRDALEARRPVGPALHASISAALGKFAARIAPKIVHEHDGTVIYSGGDDLLALLPSAQAVDCASALRKAYRDDKTHGESPAMGSKATISAGIVYVHHMEDLRAALRAARNAEKHAKDDGKDRLRLHFMRRSGEHAEATLRWELADWFSELTKHFAAGASSRWAYRLRAELPVLQSDLLPTEAVTSEIRRLTGRVDDPEWKRIAETEGGLPALIASWWENFRSETGEGLPDFVALCQGAAFVARGRDV